jgi:hypothetical protein
MNFDRTKEIVELVAVFSIVASLIFVGVQIRQEREIAATVSVAAAAEGRKYMAELISENSEVWVNGMAGNPLSEYDMAIFRSLAEAQRVDLYATWYRASRLNHVPAHRFPIEYAMVLHGNPGLLKYWRERTQQLRAVRQRAGVGESAWESAVDEQLRLLGQSVPAN